MSVRTVYRDLNAIEGELHLPVWGEDGVWGIDSTKAFLPPLKLTQQEAMAVVLSARLMVRYVDKYDPDLAAAFEKLERGLPPALAEHVERTLDVLSKAPRDERFSDNVRLLTKAWAERRVVTFDYAPARYEGGATPRRATVRPYLLEPSLQTHALYLIGFESRRSARCGRSRSSASQTAALMPQTFDATRCRRDDVRAAGGLGHHRGPAAGRDRAALHAGRRRPRPRRRPGTRPRRSEAEADGSLRWTATVVGHHRDPPLDPVVGRRRRGPRAGVVARRRGRHASAGRGTLRGGDP